MCLCWVFSNSERTPMLQSSQQEVFCVCRCYVLWVCSILLFTESSYCTESIPLPLSVPLSPPAHVLDISSLVSPKDTTAPPAPQPLKDFRYVYTHRQKVSAFEPILVDSSSPVDSPAPQPSAPPSDLDVPIALRKDKGLVLIILFFILLPIIALILLFASLPFSFLLYLYPGHMRRLYWYLPGSRPLIKRWMLLFLDELGSWYLHPQMMLWVIVGSILWSITHMIQWIGIRLYCCQRLYSDLLCGLLWDFFTSCSIELHQDSIFYWCQSVVALVPAGYHKCLLVWWFKGGGLYGITSRVCCTGGKGSRLRRQ